MVEPLCGPCVNPWLLCCCAVLHVWLDWLPAGESSVPKIQKNVLNAIGGNMSLFCLGFGSDVDYSFLDVMAKQNKGLARRIYVASDATLQLQVRRLN